MTEIYLAVAETCSAGVIEDRTKCDSIPVHGNVVLHNYIYYVELLVDFYPVRDPVRATPLRVFVTRLSVACGTYQYHTACYTIILRSEVLRLASTSSTLQYDAGLLQGTFFVEICTAHITIWLKCSTPHLKTMYLGSWRYKCLT